MRYLFIAVLAFLAQPSPAKDSKGWITYKKAPLESADFVIKKPEMKRCSKAWKLNQNAYIALCPAQGAKDPKDSGLALRFVRLGKRSVRTLYQTKGAQDAYYLRPTLFTSTDSSVRYILAEAGAELSWGAEVLSFQDEGRSDIRSLGYIEEVIEEDEEAKSIVPYTIIKARKNALEISFSKDPTMTKPDGTYARINREQLQYVLRSGGLKRSLK